MAIAAISELDAVNLSITSTGGTPVTSLTVRRQDVLSIRNLLLSSSRKVQSRGWWFNEESKITLAPDPAGRVLIPQNMLSVDPVNRKENYVQRGTFLYDKENSTYNIGTSVVVASITLLEWDQLPYGAQDVIQYHAAMQFSGGVDGDTEEFSRLRDFHDRALGELKRTDLNARDVTVRSNPMVGRVMSRRSNQTTTRFGGGY